MPFSFKKEIQQQTIDVRKPKKMDDFRIVTKITGNLLKENETLKDSLTKANQTINQLRLENRILLDELFSIRSKQNSDRLFTDEKNTAAVECLLSKEEYENIQQRICKRMMAQSTATHKRRKQSDQLTFKKNSKVSYDDEGNPILPLTLGITTIHSLGMVITDRNTFHSRRYIWPVGYKSSRTYASIVNPSAQSLYFSQIVDGGDAPRFEVWCEELPERIFSGSTPTGAWSSVVKLANEIRNKKEN